MRKIAFRYCELTDKKTVKDRAVYKVSTPCLDDNHFKEEKLESVGESSDVCFQIVVKCLYLARIGRPDILWTVNKFARSVTKWTRACDRRLARLISYIHHRRLGSLQDSDFCWRPWEVKIILGIFLVFSEGRPFVSISWMCKKQTSVSHSSRESEVVSLDAGLRMDGLPALDLWDVVIEVLHSSKSTESPTHESPGNCSRHHKFKYPKG